MRGRLFRASLVIEYAAFMLGCDVVLNKVNPLATIYYFVLVGTAIFALLFPKRARKIQRCPWRLVLIVPWAVSFLEIVHHIPSAPILGFPWSVVVVIDFVLGQNDRDDDTHLFDGLDHAVKKIVEKVEAIHVPAPRLPVPV